MRSDWEVAQAWLRKAESDLAAAEVCLAAGKALDTACFHSQQVAEKALKAWLIARKITFPLVHDLKRLLDLCARHEPDFRTMEALGLSLNPFAVEMRYDDEFWPTADEVKEALQAARDIQAFVLAHFPAKPDLSASQAPGPNEGSRQ